MMNGKATIKSFIDLKAWQACHKLVVFVYKVTQDFPSAEQFGLTSQMRRAAVSITSNIAEGFSRDTYADKCHFYVMAHASLTEVQNQFLVARDVKMVNNEVFGQSEEITEDCYKLLAGLIRATKEKK